MQKKLLKMLAAGPESFARLAVEIARGPAGRRELKRLVVEMVAAGELFTTTDETGAMWVRAA